MRLVFYHSTLQAGGAERTIARLSNYLATCGDEVTVVTADGQASFYSLKPEIRHVRLNTAQKSRNIVEAMRNNFRAVGQLRAVLEDLQPQVVVCFHPRYLLFSCLSRFGLGYAIIGSERANPYAWNTGFWDKMKKWIALCADGYLFQTAGARGYYLPPTQKKSILFPNMLEPELFVQAQKDWAERGGICAVGRLTKGKCFDDLLRAFALVHQNYPEAVLDLYGDGELREELETLSEALGLRNVVCFHGRSNRVMEEYAQHKIFVMTNESDGMPNVLMEAMASGCACVSTDCDFGPSELIRDGENGFLVPVHDADAIADRICRLLGDDELSRKLGQAAEGIRRTHSVSDGGEVFRRYIGNV